MKCPKHPTYKALRRPTCDCKKCLQIWEHSETYEEWEIFWAFWAEVKRGEWWDSEYLEDLKDLQTPAIKKLVRKVLNTKIGDRGKLAELDGIAYEACSKALGFDV